MVVGKWAGEDQAPLDFENYSKKGCLLSFEQEKQNFTTFVPPWKKFCENSPVAPPRKKNLRRPWSYNRLLRPRIVIIYEVAKYISRGNIQTIYTPQKT